MIGINDVTMMSKLQSAAGHGRVDQENLGTRLCYFGEQKNKEQNDEIPLRIGKYFE